MDTSRDGEGNGQSYAKPTGDGDRDRPFADPPRILNCDVKCVRSACGFRILIGEISTNDEFIRRRSYKALTDAGWLAALHSSALRRAGVWTPRSCRRSCKRSTRAEATPGPPTRRCT